MKGSRGFTLIELLIVIGIIAILALIALPNMLEAQTRAKVSRAKADLATVVTGLEMYCVDTNRYPTYHYVVNARATSGHSFHMGGEVNGLFNSPTFLGPHPLTSPIAYLTRFPHDVFGTRNPGEPGEAGDFYYVNWDYAVERVLSQPVFRQFLEKQGSWRLHSNGPDLGGPDSEASGDQIDYDPTNGTVSVGDIYRAKKIAPR